MLINLSENNSSKQHENSSLKTKVVRGAKWSAFSMVVLTVFRFGTSAILARILSPSDFGLMGMVMIVVGFAQNFMDLGLSSAIISRKDVHKDQLSSLFWVNVVFGCILFVSIVSTRSLVVSYFKVEALSRYLLYGALTLLVLPFGQVFTALLRKHLEFKKLAFLEIVTLFTYSFTVIGLALAGFGVLSLILSQIVAAIVNVSLLFVIFRPMWLPRLHLNFAEVKTFMRFGAYQTGEGILNYLNGSLDYIIIGRFLGLEALGYYNLAYQLVTVPLTKINPIVTKVAFPAFSMVQNSNEKLRRGYCKTLSFISTISFPTLFGLLILASQFIPFVYGEKWNPSIRIVQLLCVVGIFKSIMNPVGAILLAKGRPDIGFYWNAFVLAIISLALLIGVRWGLTGVALALAVLQVPLFAIIQWIVNRLIQLNFRMYFRSLESPLISSGIMLIALITTKQIFMSLDVLPMLLISVITGMLTYLGSYYLRDKLFLLELKSMLWSR